MSEHRDLSHCAPMPPAVGRVALPQAKLAGYATLPDAWPVGRSGCPHKRMGQRGSGDKFPMSWCGRCDPTPKASNGWNVNFNNGNTNNNDRSNTNAVRLVRGGE